MTETNIRIVLPGNQLHLGARVVQIVSSDRPKDLAERACTALRRHSLASVPFAGGSQVLVLGDNPVPPLVEQQGDLLIEMSDTGQPRRLQFAETSEASLMAQLLERCLLMEIERHTTLWSLDSRRIWYEPKPFQVVGDVAAYSRYEVSAISIDSVGVGLAIDVSTAFFTALTVDEFFREDLSRKERAQLNARFELLTARQRGQRGTLLYDSGRRKNKCYFVEFIGGETCATTGKLLISGKNYDSLLQYYQTVNPSLPILGVDSVARVSFDGINRPQRVAAKRLRIRVMNDLVPRQLKQVDKIVPGERCEIIEKFWKRLGDRPLGHLRPRVSNDHWQPRNGRIITISPPSLLFPNSNVLRAPETRSTTEYKKYYHQRRMLLDREGCLRVPPTMTRTLHFAVPKKADPTMVTRLSESVLGNVSRWTRKEMRSDFLEYESVNEAISQLHRTEPGLVIFVFEQDEPETYFKLSYELSKWRLKRITLRVLEEHFARLRQDESDRHRQSNVDRLPRGVRDWLSFVDMNALDVVQKLECVPWGIAEPLNYEAQLAIDVGWDRRHFALSLLICRPEPSRPSFSLETVVQIKTDPKKETINDVIFGDQIVGLFQRAKTGPFDPIRSVLVLRDGRECSGELDVIKASKDKLVHSELLDSNVRLDVVDFHKNSLKAIRMWSRSSSGRVDHEFPGTALLPDERTAILVNTGAPTLHQGTAEPLMLVARTDGIKMRHVVSDVHAASQLNYSSPSVGQKLPLVLKRTDEELENRARQEIRRLR